MQNVGPANRMNCKEFENREFTALAIIIIIIIITIIFQFWPKADLHVVSHLTTATRIPFVFSLLCYF